MIIAVSDVHLGYEKCNYTEFRSFLDKCTKSKNIDHLVLVGDILDFWRCNNARIVMDERSAEIFSALGNLGKTKVHYVVGNHDYYMLRLYERYKKDDPSAVFPFQVRPSLRLPDNNDGTVYFIHGYQLDVLANLEPLDIESYENISDHMCFIEDKIGWLASYVFRLFRDAFSSSLLSESWQINDLKKKLEFLIKAPPDRPPEYIKNIEKLAKSKGAYVLLGMKPDEKLVFGHTHNPCLNPPKKENTKKENLCMDLDGTIANTGSWVNEKSKECEDAHVNTYVKISNGKMECKVFNENDFP